MSFFHVIHTRASYNSMYVTEHDYADTGFLELYVRTRYHVTGGLYKAVQSSAMHRHSWECCGDVRISCKEQARTNKISR